jgi:hypothetical protein
MTLNLKVLALLAYERALNRAGYFTRRPAPDIHHWSFHFYMDDLNHNTQHHNTRR